MMNKLRIFIVSLVASAILVVGVIAFIFITIDGKEAIPADLDEPPFSMSSLSDNTSTHQKVSASERVKEVTYDGPTVQYVGAIEENDTSLYGENAQIYKAYDSDTLETLADGGDFLAIKVLADRLITNVPSYDPAVEEKRWEEYKQKKKKYAELSLIYGDLELLKDAAQILLGGYDPHDKMQVRRHALGELAFVEFAAMRGLKTEKYSEAPKIVEQYSTLMKAPLVLDSTEKAYIRERAQAIYNELEAKREALYLGPFENIEDTKAHNKFFPDYDPLKDYKNAMGENAF